LLKDILLKYLSDLQKIINRGDAREESFYHCLKDMIDAYAKLSKISKCEVGILPKTTEVGNPDFRIWDGKSHITGYIEAKKPETYNLDPIAVSEQLRRYLATFPNLILTNFYEFRLYQHGILVDSVTIASPINATQMSVTPPYRMWMSCPYCLSAISAFLYLLSQIPRALPMRWQNVPASCGMRLSPSNWQKKRCRARRFY
jgi:hypothetical protein